MYGIQAYWNNIVWACFRQYKVQYVIILNDTSKKGCSLQLLPHPHPYPRAALLVCHTASRESMTINYDATTPRTVVDY